MRVKLNQKFTNRRLNVLQVQGFSPSKWGGNVEHVSLLGRFLDPARFRVVVAAQARSGYIPRYRELGLDVRVFELAHKYDVGAIRRLWRFMRAERFDIVHTHLRNVDLAAGIAAALAGVPLKLCTLHSRLNVLPDGSRATGARARIYDCLLRRLFDFVVTVSEGTRRDAIRVAHMDPRKIRHITNGIDCTKLAVGRSRREILAECGVPEDAVVVGTLGRITEPNKGNLYLLRAVKELIPRAPRVHLVNVGDGPSKEMVAQAAADLGIAERVHLIGRRDAVADYLNAFDVFVLASLAEGMPRALMEAMYVGVACVATRIDGVPEAVTHDETGLMVPVKDPHAIAEAVLRYLENPELRARVAHAGQEHVRATFTHEAMARDTGALYEELLGTR